MLDDPEYGVSLTLSHSVLCQNQKSVTVGVNRGRFRQKKNTWQDLNSVVYIIFKTANSQISSSVSVVSYTACNSYDASHREASPSPAQPASQPAS